MAFSLQLPVPLPTQHKILRHGDLSIQLQVVGVRKSRQCKIQVHAELQQEEMDQTAVLRSFSYQGKCRRKENDTEDSVVTVQVIKPHQMRSTLDILTDSFCELLWGPLTYRPLLKLIVRENLEECQRLFPKSVVLVAVYEASRNDAKDMLVGTVEVHFISGPAASSSYPEPPSGAPYLCNMAVMQKYRRRGIGMELLKAAEEVVIQMGHNEMYLHCRLIDKVPLKMYIQAGYKVVSTGSIFSLLLLQRRKHLMCKVLI